jgi:hypothetical protein
MLELRKRQTAKSHTMNSFIQVWGIKISELRKRQSAKTAKTPYDNRLAVWREMRPKVASSLAVWRF